MISVGFHCHSAPSTALISTKLTWFPSDQCSITCHHCEVSRSGEEFSTLLFNLCPLCTSCLSEMLNYKGNNKARRIECKEATYTPQRDARNTGPLNNHCNLLTLRDLARPQTHKNTSHLLAITYKKWCIHNNESLDIARMCFERKIIYYLKRNNLDLKIMASK